jgi:hypothetical protein
VLGFAAALSFRIPQVGPRGSLQGDDTDDERALVQESELIAETAQTQ